MLKSAYTVINYMMDHKPQEMYKKELLIAFSNKIE